MFTPSPQQADFLTWCANGRGSCVLEAVAGSGKTTTLLHAARLIRGQTGIMAYNTKIADEIKRKLNEIGLDWQKAQAGTVHSFGFKAFRKIYPNVVVEGSKVSDIADKMFPEGHAYEHLKSRLCHLVSLAKNNGFGIFPAEWMQVIDHHDIDLGQVDENGNEHDISDKIAAAAALLDASNSDISIIDFDDMVYLPLLMNLKFWQFDNVMLDEAQDTNRTRRELAKRMLKPNGRLIAVGDRAQAIYGFTGADNNSLDLIRKDFQAMDMPMTKTFRCPKAVVTFARQWVDHIEAVDSAPEGLVTSIGFDDFNAGAKADTGLSTAAILCRNTKPLVSMALSLIRQKIACKVEGRDVGANLRKLAKRWKVTTTRALEGKLENYLSKERAKLMARKREAQVQTLEDTVETLRVIIQQCNAENKTTVEDVVAYIDNLFADNVTNMLVLSTIHKSKGREWNQVYWLDRANLNPSRYAKQDWEKIQERNLCYVAATRSQRELIEITV